MKRQKSKSSKANEKCKIQRLENSIYYGIETVIILFGEKSYRLIGVKLNRVIIDHEYRTLRGAKIAFSRYYQERAYHEDVLATWSHTYPVDWRWLEPKLDLCNRQKKKYSKITSTGIFH